jgi:alkylation response protein AidB-like acyl-CoA dehydrogenase
MYRFRLETRTTTEFHFRTGFTLGNMSEHDVHEALHQNSVNSNADVSVDVSELADLFEATASSVDQTDTIPAELFDGLAKAGLYGTFAPTSLGGLEFSLSQMCDVIEVLAAASLAPTFVWMQHFRLLAALMDPSTPDDLRALLPRAVSGDLKGGVALGGLLPGPARLRAVHSDEGWILNGDAPWVSGWGIVDVLFVTARGPDNTVVSCILDARDQPGLSATSQALSALNATATVRLDFDGFLVNPDRFVSQLPYAPGREGREGLRANGSLALGVTRRCCALLGPSSLDDELRDRRAALDSADADAMPLARARATELAVRAAHVLGVERGSRASLAGDVAERTTREASLLLVFGSRPSIKTALLELLSRGPTGATAP